MDLPLVWMIMSHAMTNVPWQSSQRVESQRQVPAGATGVQMIQGSSKARNPSGSFSSSRKKKKNYWEWVWSMRVRERKTSCRAVIYKAGLPKSPAWEAMQPSLDTLRKVKQFAHWFTLLSQVLSNVISNSNTKLKVHGVLLLYFPSFPWGHVSSDSCGCKELGAVQTVPSKGSFLITLQRGTPEKLRRWTTAE